jgi:hypothetical protein
MRKSNLAKGDFWAPCPFHQEKSASFHVDDRKGFYYCFGCHAKGDAVTFVKETGNLGFMEAVEVLAREAGMTVPARDPRAAEQADRRTLLVQVMEEAVKFYRLQLKTAAGAEARRYLAEKRRLSEAALAEPLSVGLHAIQRAGSVLGKQVLVTGCGPIGSLLIGALRRAGAARIVAADIADLPLKCAKEMGADEAINLKTDAAALDKYKVDKGQFDAVFEASGSEAALRVGLDTIVPRGVLITVGMGGDISLPMTQIVAKEVDLRGTFRFHAEFATAVRFLNEGLVNGKPVITGILPVERAIEAFDLAADKSQSLKVQISFQNA